MRARPLLLGAAALLGLGALYLLLWPTGVDPVVYAAPPSPPLEGAYAVNDRLAAAERLAEGAIEGPEATAIDADGRVYTGLLDGRIVRFAAGGRGAPETVTATGGRPLGMAFDAAGSLIVADAYRGLLSVAPSGAITVLATEQGGVPLRFTDDVDIAKDGTIYFTDASSRWDLARYVFDILERRPSGRLLAYRPSEGRVDLVAGDLCFANGVALAPDGSFAAVCETSACRVTRVWLSGPRKGTRDALIDALPGLPDNVTFSRARGCFWVALPSLRDAGVDALAGLPFARRAIARLPAALLPKPVRHGFALGVDVDGRVVENLQDPRPVSYSPVTSVREHEGVLWLGSFMARGLGRIAAPPLPPR